MSSEKLDIYSRYKNKWLLYSVLSIIILSLYNLVISWTLQVIIDIISGVSKIGFLTVVYISIVSFIVFISAYLVYRIARPKYLQSVMLNYKQSIFDNLINKQISSFCKENTGRYLSIYSNDLAKIEENYFDSTLEVIDLSVSFIGAIILMLWYSPIMTVCAFILAFLPILASLTNTQKLIESENEVSDANSNFITLLKDILLGFSLIKSFKAENEIKLLFNQNIKINETVKYQLRYLEETINILGTASSVMMRIGIFLIGAFLSLNNENITPGMVLLFLQLMNYIISPIEKFPALIAKRRAALMLMDKISNDIEKKQNEYNEISIDKLFNGVFIENLFIEIEKNVVINNLNINFEINKKYAIVGSTASGKSTLLHSIMGNYPRYKGSIKFDDQELSNISSDSIFDILTLVQQEVFIFNDTILNNITMYKTFETSKIKFAIEYSGLKNVIDKKGGNYLCGENGSKLSGGERQRISIARALLKGSQFLLLDEITSSLDKATSFDIINSILNIKDLGIISVTHRLEENILNKYDEIIVINNGNIVEQGSFSELLLKKSYFYSLYYINKLKQE